MQTVGADKRLNYYRMAPEAVVAELHSHKMGLTNAEAQRRREANGDNTLYRAHRESVFIILARQLKSLFVLILLISAVFSLYLHDDKTATILLAIALANTLIGFFQEHRAGTLLASLERLLVPRAKVIRNGELKQIDSTGVVLGDIIYLEAGDSVPADLRILDEDELATNDFALTGESNPTRKFVHAITAEVPVAERQNLAYMGTTVASGTAHGVVIGTGMYTELGRIAGLSQATPAEASPLQREMNNLATRIAQATVVLAIILAIVALQANLGLKAALLFAISISAAMIPNGLAAEVNITLAQTANRMAKVRALVKKLSAVETLGAINVILTDKTGTLTKNEMTVTDFVVGRTRYAVTGTGYEPRGDIRDERREILSAKTLSDLSFFFTTGTLASNARISPPDSQHANWYVLGDPTEGAVVSLARKAGLDTVQLDSAHKEVKELQFDSARKLMTSVRRYDGQLVAFVKGAPEALLERSRKLWDHGHVRRLTATDKHYFSRYNDQAAEGAMRNLALAYRVLPKGTKPSDLTIEGVEQDLIFLGIVSMHDPIRDDVPAAMLAAREAHIHISVVTGDYPATARAAAAQAHLAAAPDAIQIVRADELPQLSDSQIAQLIQNGGVVFSRVSPEDKLRLVEIAKADGQVVAVTGDGINDAPALKRADIGVAMGQAGTDVAKDAAEIVLLDDSFATLVSAIRQGRLTFQNIKKAARCALTDNVGELGTILVSLAGQALWHIPLAITAIQILAIDIVAEVFPITALGWDQAAHTLMRDHPRNTREHIINSKTASDFVMFGLLAAGLSYANFLLFFSRQGLSAGYIDTAGNLYAQATTLTYVTLILCQFMNLLLVRADDQPRFFSAYLWSNKRLLAAFALSFFCIANIVYNPALRSYLHSRPLSAADWLMAAVAASVYLAVRLIQRHTRRHTRRAIIKLHQEIHGKASPARV